MMSGSVMAAVPPWSGSAGAKSGFVGLKCARPSSKRQLDPAAVGERHVQPPRGDLVERAHVEAVAPRAAGQAHVAADDRRQAVGEIDDAADRVEPGRHGDLPVHQDSDGRVQGQRLQRRLDRALAALASRPAR